MTKLNSYLLRSSLVAALGGLLFGFDTAVIAGTTRALTETFGLSAAMLGVTVSMALWERSRLIAGRSAERPLRPQSLSRGARAALHCLRRRLRLGMTGTR